MNRQRTIVVILWVLVCICAPAVVWGDSPFFLRGGERIVFFGDSITQAGLYVQYVEAYLLTRFPDKQFEVINRGISSETLSGTSEPDHDPPRPDAHDRFSRDITPLKPNVLVSCFGMNDGNYQPFSEELFSKYKEGIERLIRRAKNEAKTKLVIMTPPPFDPYRAGRSDPDATHWGYRYPYLGYDDVLERYSRWLLTLQREGLTVVDVHSAINRHLGQRRKTKVSYYVSGDAVHPNPTGHWLMAQTLLLAWNGPAEAGLAEVDVKTKRVIRGNVADLQVQDGEISFTWQTGLPMPVDPQWQTESIAMEEAAERLNRYRLKVTSLPADQYQLFVSGQPIFETSRDRLAKGINLLDYADFPTVKKSQEVLKLVQQGQREVYALWRKSIKEANEDLLRAANEKMSETRRMAHQLCRPKPIALRLVPVGGN